MPVLFLKELLGFRPIHSSEEHKMIDVVFYAGHICTFQPYFRLTSFLLAMAGIYELLIEIDGAIHPFVWCYLLGCQDLGQYKSQLSVLCIIKTFWEVCFEYTPSEAITLNGYVRPSLPVFEISNILFVVTIMNLIQNVWNYF